MAFAAKEFNSDEFNSGGLHEKHAAAAAWNLGTALA
jgi:hypothetical protein